MLEAYTLQADYLLAQLSDLNEDLDDFQARPRPPCPPSVPCQGACSLCAHVCRCALLSALHVACASALPSLLCALLAALRQQGPDWIRCVQEDTLEELDRKRNQLFALQLLITIVTMGFSFVSMVSGVFGMNLWNSIGQDSPVAFTVATLGPAFMAFAGTVAMVVYLRSRRMLFVGA